MTILSQIKARAEKAQLASARFANVKPSADDVLPLVKALEKAIEQRDNALILYYTEVKGDAAFQIENHEAEIASILKGEA